MNVPVPPPTPPAARRVSICALGTGGSSGRTLARVEAAARDLLPSLAFTLIDIQPFNHRTGGTTTYDGAGEHLVVTPQAWGLTQRTGSWSLDLLLDGGPLAFRKMVREATSLLAARRPDVLVLCHDRLYSESAFIAAARALNVPTVLLQEGPFCAIGSTVPQALTLRLKSRLAPLATTLGLLPRMPDYGCAGHARVLAASAQYRERWIAAGVPAAQLEVVGIPRFDSLAALRSDARPRRADGEPPRLLYLVQPFAAHGKVDGRAADALLLELADALNALQARRPLRFAVRQHPRSSSENVAVLKQKLAFPFELDDPARPLEASLVEYDLLLGHYSSGLLESLMAGTPIVCLPVPETAFAEASEAAKQRWIANVGAPVGRTAPEIVQAIEDVLDSRVPLVDPQRLAEEVGVVDGGASRRAAACTLGIAGVSPVLTSG